MFFFTYLRRELRRRMRQAIVVAVGLALGIGLVITVTALSSGVRTAQGKVLGALYGVGTDITVTTATAPAGFNQVTPKPYVQHSDTLGSPSLGTLNASAVAAISGLRKVTAAAGGLVLTEIKTTIPADNAPPPSSFQPRSGPAWSASTRATGPWARSARHISSRAGPSPLPRRTQT
jgi:hypothetical protein